MSGEFMLRFADQTPDVLSAILDQSLDCITLLDLAGDVEYMNHNGCAAMGLPDFDRVAAGPWAQIWPESGREAALRAIEQAQRGERARFESYAPTDTGEPRWWDVEVSPVADRDGKRTHILVIARDITMAMQERLDDRLRREAAEREVARMDGVAREMRHRLKNQLAVIASVTKLVARHSQTPREVTERLDVKLQNLARAQDLLMVHRDRPITAAEAIRQVLDASGAGERIAVEDVPVCALGDNAVQQLALILGELQTNSLKYGALSHDRGAIALSATGEGGVLTLCWDEDTGAPVTPPTRKGLGATLIERMGATAGRRAAIAWHPRGPRVEFHVRMLA